MSAKPPGPAFRATWDTACTLRPTPRACDERQPPAQVMHSGPARALSLGAPRDWEALQIGSMAPVWALLRKGAPAREPGVSQPRETQTWPFPAEQAAGGDQGSWETALVGTWQNGCFRFTGRVSSPRRRAAPQGPGLGGALEPGLLEWCPRTPPGSRAAALTPAEAT